MSGDERHRRQGVRRLGHRGRDPPARPQGSRDRALAAPRGRRRDVHAQPRCRRPACRSTATHLELADPQAVVINSGVANAATGERGQDRRARDRRRGGTAARPRHRGGARPLDRRDRRAAAAAQAAAGPRAGGRGALGERRRGRGRGDHDHRHPRQGGRRLRATGFTVGGMTKGSGMIHPDLATMLAVVTTDYPLEPGEAIEPAAAGRRDVVQRDLGRRRALHQRLRDPARKRRERHRRAPPATDAAFAAALVEVCSDLARQVVADGEGITVLAEINVTGAVDDAQAKAIARRDRHLAARQDGALRPRRQLGPRPDGRRQRALERRLRDGRRRPGDAPLQRHRRPRRAARRPTSSRTSRARPARSTSTSASDRGQRRLPDERPLLRLRPHQRGLPDMSMHRRQGRRRGRRELRGGDPRARRTTTRSASSTAPARRSAPRWSAPASRSSSSAGGG